MLLLPCFTFIFRLPFLFFVYKHFDKRVILVSRESDGFFVWFNLLFKSNFWIFYLLVQVQTRIRLVKKRKSYLLSVDFQRPFSEFIKCYKLVNYKNESKQHASKLFLISKVQAVLHLILYWLGFNIVISLNTLQI